MHCDGTQARYDVLLTWNASESTSILLVASDGAEDLGHILNVPTEARADAALPASTFHRSEHSKLEVKESPPRDGVCVHFQ